MIRRKTSLTALKGLEILIHFTAEKTVTEAQLLVLSAEIVVFLATTKDSSSAYVAVDHRHHGCAGNAELCCQTAPPAPEARYLHGHPPRQNGSPVCSS